MKTKRIISVILTFVLLCSCCVISAGADDIVPKQPEYPIVIVRGMDFQGLWVNYGTDEQENCIQGVTVGGVLKTLAKSIVKAPCNGGFSTSLVINAVDYCDTVMGKMYCDANGDSIYNVGVAEYPLAVINYPELIDTCYGYNMNEFGILLSCIKNFGAENCYYFQYDWRLDHRDTADKLNELITTAKTDHGADKVILLNCSMGGVITNAYISEYGSGSLAKVLFLSSTFQGTDVATDCLTGKLKVTSQTLYNYIKSMTGSCFLAGLLKYTGVLKVVELLAGRLLTEKNKGIIYDYFRRGFANIPAFWMNVQPESYADAIEYIFPTQELKDEHAALIEKTDALIEIMSEADSFIPALVEDGVAVAVVAGYNIADIPVYESSILQGDGILDSRWMLGGAVVSAVGSDLGSNYVPADSSKLSPDRCVDLSGVMFPDYTWAVKNGSHVNFVYGTDSGDFICWLIDFDGQPTVHSDPRYPQFMQMTSSFNYTDIT